MVLEEMWRAGNNELVTGTGLLSLKISQRYETHLGRKLVVSGGFREILNVWSWDASRESM